MAGAQHLAYRTIASFRHTSGEAAPKTTDSVFGGFVRHVPFLPVPPAFGRLIKSDTKKTTIRRT